MGVTSYRELIAWKKAMELVKQIYRASGAWPESERYGLRAQVQRAAVSVPSNIAEGQGRGPGRDFEHHLRIAYGSLMEVETQLQIAYQLGYATVESTKQLLALSAEVGRLINGLLHAVIEAREQ